MYTFVRSIVLFPLISTMFIGKLIRHRNSHVAQSQQKYHHYLFTSLAKCMTCTILLLLIIIVVKKISRFIRLMFIRILSLIISSMTVYKSVQIVLIINEIPPKNIHIQIFNSTKQMSNPYHQSRFYCCFKFNSIIYLIPN